MRGPCDAPAVLQVYHDTAVGHQAGLSLIVEHRNALADGRDRTFALEVHALAPPARPNGCQRLIVHATRLLAARHSDERGGRERVEGEQKRGLSQSLDASGAPLERLYRVALLPHLRGRISLPYTGEKQAARTHLCDGLSTARGARAALLAAAAQHSTGGQATASSMATPPTWSSSGSWQLSVSAASREQKRKVSDSRRCHTHFARIHALLSTFLIFLRFVLPCILAGSRQGDRGIAHEREQPREGGSGRG